MGHDQSFRRQAGVDPDLFADFTVGQHVMTVDGVPGVVVAVLQGPYPQTEAYEVTLDHGLGGGQYATRDLSPLEPVTAARTGQPLGEEQTSAPVLGAGHLASEDYPELEDILVQRPPLARSEPLAMFAHLALRPPTPSDDAFLFEGQIEHTGATPLVCADCGQTYFTDSLDEKHGCQSKTAAFGDTFFNVVDKATDYVDKRYPGSSQGDTWSYDWCRFRRDRHCFYPKDLNLAASQQTGYAVWSPVDRGQCWRDKWEEQKACTVAAPGPHSGDPNALTDATVAWEMGGQHGGVVVGALQVEAAFEFTAQWAEVRSKAKRIRTSGGVNVLSVTGSVADGRTVAGRVQGDHGVYDTEIVTVPGKYSVGYWTCSCPWATYSWGRSGRWKKYEGRMCAHALALSFEVQARGMFGKDVSEDVVSPDWAVAASLRPVETDPWLALSPASHMAAEMLSQGFEHPQVLARFGAKVVHEAITMNFKERLKAVVRGVVHKVRQVITETGQAVLEDGSLVPVSDLVYPDYDPAAGLLRTSALMDDDPLADSISLWDASAGDDPQDSPQGYGTLVDPEEAGGAVSSLHEEPEPALPSTDGVQVTGSLPDASTRAWILSDSQTQGNEEIAAMARQSLAKMAVKTFSQAEQAEIINEGEGVTAANLDRLQLEGTHYEGLDEDEDDSWVG